VTAAADDVGDQPLFQFLPGLSDEEYRSLEDSIREHGIQVPILVDENGAVIDGHHRKEIADRLGLDCPRRFAMELTETQKRTLALSLNLDRRHLSREQRRELVAASLTADPQLSNREHARRTGANHETVAAIREPLVATGGIRQLDRTTGADGRERPSTRASKDEVTEGDRRRTPRQKATPAAFWDATYELRKKLTTLENIVKRPNFPRNRKAIREQHLGELIRYSNELKAIISALTDPIDGDGPQ